MATIEQIEDLALAISSWMPAPDFKVAHQRASALAALLSPQHFEVVLKNYDDNPRTMLYHPLSPRAPDLSFLMPRDQMARMAYSIRELNVADQVDVWRRCLTIEDEAEKHRVLRELWKVGLTDSQFKQFCEETRKESFVLTLARRRILGRVEKEKSNTAAQKMRRCLYRADNISGGVIHYQQQELNDRRVYGFKIPTCYFLIKSAEELSWLKRRKEEVFGLNLDEE
jgi:hypothetical protein